MKKLKTTILVILLALLPKLVSVHIEKISVEFLPARSTVCKNAR